MRPLVSMRQAISDAKILGSAFPLQSGQPDSWIVWKAMAIAAMGEKLKPKELAAYRKVTNRETAPTERAEELVIVKGRRSGGTTFSAVVLAYLAALVDYSAVLGVGERASALLLAPSQRQAEIAFQRVEGLFDASPLLSKMIISRTNESLSLNNGVDVEIKAASYRSLRGLTLAAAVADEAAFFQAEGKNTDTEIMNAIRPALMTTRGLLVIASSPYAAKGELFELFSKYYGKDGPVLVAKATSRETNPTLSEAFIARQMERDPVSARAEYGGEFRTDVSGFIDRDKLMAAVDAGVAIRAPSGNHVAFCDAAAGLEESADGDSFTLSIGHAADDGTVTIDLAQEWKPPFNAANVTAEVATILRRYGCDSVTSDGYSVGFLRGELARHGIGHNVSELDKSGLYAATLPMLTSGRVRLLDNETLINQFTSLERRPGANGRDKIDSRGHEDLANAVAGVIAMLSAVKPIAGWGLLEHLRRQAEAAKAEAAPPSVQQALSGEALAQIGNKPQRPADYVMVRVPNGASNISISGGGDYLTEVVDGAMVCWMSPPDARELLSPLNPVFTEANAELVARLGVRVQPRGVRAIDLIAAAEDARPRSPFDRGGHALDALRAVGRWT